MRNGRDAARMTEMDLKWRNMIDEKLNLPTRFWI